MQVEEVLPLIITEQIPNQKSSKIVLLFIASFSAFCAIASIVSYSVILALNYGQDMQIQFLLVTCGIKLYPFLIVMSVVVLVISILCIVLLGRKKQAKFSSFLSITSVVCAIISFALLINIFQFRKVSLPLKVDRSLSDIHWDPVFQPFEDGALATWYEDGFQKSEKLPLSGVFELNGEQFPYEIPKEVYRLLVVSDMHSNETTIQQYGQDYDLLINSGDLTFNGYDEDYVPFFSNQKKPFLWASGNHDRWNSDTVKVMGRPNDFYQKVGRIGFYITYFEEKTYEILRQLLTDHIQNDDVDHQFFVVHFPIYTRGGTKAKEFQKYVSLIEEFLDKNPEHRIRAFLTGHDHLFDLFNRSNVFFLVNSPSGGDDETQYQEFQPDNPRYFTGTLGGPLEPIGDDSYGWEYHVYSCLWSYMKVKTYIDIFSTKLVYTLIDMDTNSTIRSWDQHLN